MGRSASYDLAYLDAEIDAKACAIDEEGQHDEDVQCEHEHPVASRNHPGWRQELAGVPTVLVSKPARCALRKL
jgi:hypothetical protein